VPRPSVGRWVVWIGLFTTLSAFLYWSFLGSEFSAQRLWRGVPQLVSLFSSRMVPPEWPAAETLWQASLETLHTVVAGTFLGALFAYPLGVLAASNWTPTWIHLPTKAVLALIRSCPVLLLALLFISAFGLGAFPGMLAIAIHSIGVLGRYVAEEVEATDPRALRAIQGTGASKLQVLQHGLVPQVLPQMLAHLAIRFEMNVRDATILGVVGGGGLGFYVLLHIKQFHWERTGPFLLVIVLLVFGSEMLSWQIRKRLL